MFLLSQNKKNRITGSDRTMKKWTILIVLILVALCLSGCGNKPETAETPSPAPTEEPIESKYRRGQELLAKAWFADAAVLFDELGGYEDSSKLAMYCKAASAGESGEYDTAFSSFKLLGDYKDSPLMIPYYEARREESHAVSDNQPDWRKWITAADMYDALAVFRDSQTRAESCRKAAYNYAVQRSEEGDHYTAIQVLERLGEYSDSPLLSRYTEAKRQESMENYNEASAIFAELGSYKDAAEQVTAVLQRGYEYAESLETEGNLEHAYTVFMNLGDYKDSFERANKPFYDLGVSERAAGNWVGAIYYFTHAGTYSDAAEQILATYYAEGEAKRASQDWDNAITALKQAGSYSDAAEQILATRYAEGEAKRAAQDWDNAITAFKQAGSYSDAAEQILATRYAEGEAKRAAQDWDGAVTAFGHAGTYSDAETQIPETRYQQAKFLMSTGDYTGAYSILVQIQGYQDVGSMLENDDNLIAAAHETKRASYKEVGNIVTFGTYPQTAAGFDSTPIEWIVLDYDEANHKALLLSKYGLEAKPYNTEWVDVTWETCTLRSWLNNDFLNKAFSAEEQSAILTAAVNNSAGQGYSGWSTDGGNNTQDKIFLLSYAEANRYLGVKYWEDDYGNNMKSRVAPTEYAIQTGAWISDSYKTADGKPAGWWWLRSPGRDQRSAADVDVDGSLDFDDVNCGSGCVRPAFWLNLESGIF